MTLFYDIVIIYLHLYRCKYAIVSPEVGRKEVKMYCTVCGKEIPDDAVICTGCGCAVKKEKAGVSASSKTSAPASSKASLILGIIGIITAWLIALVGHITSIIGIILGIKEYKKTGNMSGLILSIIGEVCAILSSIIGAVMMGGMYY